MMQKKLVPDYIRNLQVYQAENQLMKLPERKGLSNISKLASNENPLGLVHLPLKK